MNFLQYLSLNMSDQIVKYGDIISLHGYLPNIKSPTDVQHGLLISKGFTDTDLYFAFNNLQCISRQELFRILPKSSFQIHDQVVNNQDETVDIQSRKQKQIEQFMNNIKIMDGSDIHFGEHFILNHVLSNTYLKGCFICGQAGFGAFKLELTKEYSSDIIFKIEPYRSFQKLGQKFRYSTPFRFHHIHSSCYLNYNQKQIFISKTFEDIHPINQIKYPIRYPTVNQSKSPLILTMHNHFKFEEIKIQHQDVIYLQYSKNMGFLACDINQNLVYIKESVHKHVPYEALWQVHYITDQDVYLRHYIYKKILGIDEYGKIQLVENLEKRLKVKPVALKANLQSRDLINLTYQQQILAYKCKHHKIYLNKLLEHCQKQYRYHELELCVETAEHSFKILKIDEETKYVTDYLLSSTELLVKFRCFLSAGIDKQSIESIIIVNFNQYLQESIKKTLQKLLSKLFQNNIKSSNLPRRETALMMRDLGIIDIIVDIIEVFGDIYENLKGFDEFSGKGNEIDNLIRIFEYCYKLLQDLCSIFELKLYISQYLHLFLAQFYQIKQSFVLNFVYKILENNHLSIASEIKYSDIEFAVNSFIKENNATSSFIKLLRFFCYCGKQSIKSNQDIVKSLLFIPENKHLIKFHSQQQQVYIQYIQKKYPLYDFFTEYKNKETWRYIYQYLQLLADISIHQNTQNYKYISQHIISYQTICAFINSSKLKQIKKELTKNEKSLLNPLIRVVHSCYIDVQGFQTIRRIAKVREWKDIDKKNIILKSHSEKKKKQLVFINKVIDFICNYLKQLKSIRNFEENRTLLSLLELLRSTITLGFWEDIEQFRQLIPFLIKIVKYDSASIIKQIEDTVKNKMMTRTQLQQLVLKKKEKINLEITKEQLACKIKSLDIIDIIMDMQTNIRISLLTYFFKGLYWYTIDFQKYLSKVSLQFSCHDSNKHQPGAMSFMKELKHKKQSDLFDNYNLWINRMKELTPIEKENVEIKMKRYLFDRFQSIQKVFLPLMQLSQYRNYELMNYGLLILSRIFGQRKDLINNFENVIIVAEGNFNKISKKSRQQIRSKLKFLEIPNIRQLTKQKDEKQTIRIWKPYVSTEQIEEKKKSGVIQDLCYLIQMMKVGRRVDDSSLKNLYQYDDLGSNITIYTQRDYPNSLYQKLIKNQDSHLVLLKYIELINNPDSNQIHLKCLHAIYNYMTMLIWNHSKNKSDLTANFKLVTKHLKWNIGVADFITELFKNNKNLVKSDISWFISFLLDELRKRKTNEYYKSKLLDIFRVMCIFNDKGVKKNQLQILSSFQKTKFQILDLTNLNQYIQQYEANLKVIQENSPQQNLNEYYQKNKLVICSELTYVIVYFQTFSCLIESKHQINIGKCSNIHPYTYLLALVQKARNCWPFLRHLRGYINRLYYIPVDYDILMFEQFLKKQLSNLGKETEKFIHDFEIEYNHHELIQIKYPIRFTYLSSYSYCAMVQILTSVYEMLCKPKFVDHLKHCISTSTAILDEIMNLIELFGYIHFRIQKRKRKSKFLLCYLKQIKSEFLNLLDVIPFKYMQQKYDKEFSYEDGDQQVNFATVTFAYDYSKPFFRNFIEMLSCHKINTLTERVLKNSRIKNLNVNMDQFTKKIKYVDLIFTKIIKRFDHIRIEQIYEIEQGQRNLRNDKILLHHSKSFNVLGKVELNHDAQNVVLNQIHEKICLNMKNEEIYHTYKDNEFMKFVKLFLNFDNLQNHYYQEEWKKIKLNESIKLVTIQDFILSVIEMIKNNPAAIKNQSKIEFVRILRLYITETIQQGKEKLSVDKWDSGYIKQQKKEELGKRQQFLIKANCHQLIFTIFKQDLTNNITLLNQLLLLAIALLFGGNRICQTALLNQIIRDKENLMLISIDQIIKIIGKQLYKITKIKDNIVDNKFIITHEDTYDYFNVKDRTMQRKFTYCYDTNEQRTNKKQKTNVLNRVFRFLQLLCQNNNIQMKQFLRLQKDQNGQQRPNSINFIQKTTLLLRKFFKIMNNNIIDIPLFLLDFVNQVTQLPCVDNQITFCKSSYLEDLCFMQTFMTKQKMRSRLIEEKQDIDKLFEIYNKSVTLVLSNMQGNNEIIYDQIRNKLSIQFLQSLTVYNFTEILNELNIKNSQEVPITKNNVKKVLDQMNKKQFSQHYLCIINILSLLKKESDNNNSDQKNKRINQFFQNQFQPLREINNQILRIEVNLFSRQYIYFPKHPLFSSLSKETQEKIMQNVDRDTQRDKLNGLFNYTQQLIQQMQLFQNLTTSGYNDWRDIALIISCIINILIIFMTSIQIEFGSNDIDFYYENLFYSFIIKILSLAQLVFSFFYLIKWAEIRSELAVKKQIRSQKNVFEQSQTFQHPTVTHLKSKIEPLLKKLHVVKSLYNHQNQFATIVIFIAGSLAGVFIGPQFFSLHLFNLFSRTAILKSVFEAIQVNAKQLLTVSLLGVFFIYTFSIICLSFNVYTVPQQKQSCQNVIDCILSIYVSGTIGQDMETFQPWKFLGDLIYIVMMQLLFSNIVSGIMIDTFAQLKDKKKVILQDMKNNCFICGITRSQVEKKNKDFQQHLSQEHYLWNYIFYIYCLKKKDQTEYSGIEYSISQKLDKEDLSWIPISEEKQEEDIDQEINLQLQLQKIKNKLEKIED